MLEVKKSEDVEATFWALSKIKNADFKENDGNEIASSVRKISIFCLEQLQTKLKYRRCVNF